MELKNTKTSENLQRALADESIAKNKYTFFAQAAQANGDNKIADAFERMAKNEMMHTRFWFEHLFGKPTDTKECLMQTAQGEYSELFQMYSEFTRQTREDGLEQLAVMFEKVAAIERSHEKAFLTLLPQLNSTAAAKPAETTVASAPKQKKTGYRCQFCGSIFEERPDVCETCEAIGAFEYSRVLGMILCCSRGPGRKNCRGFFTFDRPSSSTT